MIKLLKKSLALLLLTLLFLQPLANTSFAILPSTADTLKQLTDTLTLINQSKEKLSLTDCYSRCFDPSSKVIKKELPYCRGKIIPESLKGYLIHNARLPYVIDGTDTRFTQIGKALSKHGDLSNNTTDRIFGFFYNYWKENVPSNVTTSDGANAAASKLLTDLLNDPESLWCANSISDADTGAAIQILEIWSKEAFIADEDSEKSESAKETRRKNAYAIRFYIQGDNKRTGHLRGIIEYVDEKKAEEQISIIAEKNAQYNAQLEAQREKARTEKQAAEEFKSDTSSEESVQNYFNQNLKDERTEAQKKLEAQIKLEVQRKQEEQRKLEIQRRLQEQQEQSKQKKKKKEKEKRTKRQQQQRKNKRTLEALVEQRQLAPPVPSSDSTTTNPQNILITKFRDRISEIDFTTTVLTTMHESAFETINVNTYYVFKSILLCLLNNELHKNVSESLKLKRLYIDSIPDKDVDYKRRLLEDIKREETMIQCLPLKVSLRSQDAIGYITKEYRTKGDRTKEDRTKEDGTKEDCSTNSEEFITKNFDMFKDRVQELENKLREHILKNTHPEQISEQSQPE